MRITDEQVEEALQYLAIHDEPMAQAYADVEKYSELKKITVAELMNASGKSSAKDREADALASKEYREFLDTYTLVIKRDRQYQLKAKYLNTLIDVYRTTSANQRRGTV